VSAGVVEYRRGESAMNLLDRAHDALCEAQGAGGNRVVTRGATESFDADVIRLRSPQA
jgi:PleD family two-component response regulator